MLFKCLFTVYFIYVSVFVCMYMFAPHDHMCVVPVEARRVHWVLWTMVTGSCELSCACWEPTLGPRQEQPVLLANEATLQPS